VSVTDDGSVLFTCRAGCSQTDVLDATGIAKRDLFAHGSGRASGAQPEGRGCNSNDLPKNRGEERGDSECGGLTLASYTAAKRLDLKLLEEFGLQEVRYSGLPALKVPYYDLGREEAAIRFRLRLEKGPEGDGRFRWRKGSKPLLYGLWRLERARDAGYVVLVEGESDCHTLWSHDVPALGIPGSSTWRHEWSEHLDGLATVYAIVEPDSGGEKLAEKLSTAAFADRLRLVRLEGAKDASELHLQTCDEGGFADALDAALEAAVPAGPPCSTGEAGLRAELAAMGDLDYDHERAGLAERYGGRLATLDLIRREERKQACREPALEFEEVEPWPEPVCGVALVGDIVDALRRFVVLSEEACLAAGLWVLHAHAHDAAAISPILLVTAPMKGCGKSTLLDVIGRLVPRPLVSAASTAAALYRSAQASPTVLCDEGDTYLGEDRRLVAFFNAGHRRGVPFRVCEGDANEVRAYPSWCPKAIAMIGLPRDATIADRSIRVELQRQGASESAEPFSSTHAYPRLRDLARQCARWAADHVEKLREVEPELPAGFANRLADNWRAPLAIAEVAGGGWPERARRAALAIGEVPDSDLSSVLLADMHELFEGVDFLYTETLVEQLLGLPERPWRSVRRGKGLDSNWLARTLATFNVRSERIVTGSNRQRGYTRDALEPVWRRYLAQPLCQLVQAVHASAEPSEVGQVDGLDSSAEPLREPPGPEPPQNPPQSSRKSARFLG
jgi:putative DNA primase/helicase